MTRGPYNTGATREIWLLLASAERRRCTREIKRLADLADVSSRHLAGTLRTMERLGRAVCERRGRFNYFYVTEQCEIPSGISVQQVQQAFARRAATGVSS